MIGSTIREIRIGKRMQAKDLYLDIMTKTNYVRFEKNHVDISANKLMHIISRLNMTFEEVLFIQHTYSTDTNTLLWKQYAGANNVRDIRTLKDLANKNKDSSDMRTKIIGCLCDITVQSLQEEPINQKSATLIVSYLSNIDLWTLDEISIFTSSFYLFNDIAQSNLMELCMKSMDKYKLWSNYLERILNLLTNYIYHCYWYQRIEEGDHWLNILNEKRLNTSTIYQGFYRELCNQIYNLIHTKKYDRNRLVILDNQIKELLGSSTLLKEFDNILNQYKV